VHNETADRLRAKLGLKGPDSRRQVGSMSSGLTRHGDLAKRLSMRMTVARRERAKPRNARVHEWA